MLSSLTREGREREVKTRKVRHVGVKGLSDYARRHCGALFPSKLDVAGSRAVSRSTSEAARKGYPPVLLAQASPNRALLSSVVLFAAVEDRRRAIRPLTGSHAAATKLNWFPPS